MPSYKLMMETFYCSQRELQNAFTAYKAVEEERNGGFAPPGSLAASKGRITIRESERFTMRDVAEARLSEFTRVGGEPVAVRVAEAHPVTGPIDPATDERRMVWLVGAKCPDPSAGNPFSNRNR